VRRHGNLAAAIDTNNADHPFPEPSIAGTESCWRPEKGRKPSNFRGRTPVLGDTEA
jgi:hypothetical protein